MGENSKIEWTRYTFNPWIGCQKVSPGCDHCYAESQNEFRKWNAAGWGPHAPRKRTSGAYWQQPLKWNREAEAAGVRRRVFCASLADVFDNHGSITSGWHGDLWYLIDRTPHLDWLLLTKRPQNIKGMLPEEYGFPAWGKGWANVWLGTTVENQTEADRRIPALLSVPARVHFLSCEPLLGPIEFSDVSRRSDALQMLGKPALFGIDWIIAGGESGPAARPMHPDWARSLRDQCQVAGVPFLFKQWGEWDADALLYTDMNNRCPPPKMKVGKKKSGRVLDGVTHDSYPEVR